MVRMEPIKIGDWTATGVEVRLPGTTLLAVTAGNGYIMCGALDVRLLNERLSERQIVAGRALGVRTLEQLLEAPLESVTHAAEAMGITAGTVGEEAVRMMAAAAAAQA